MTGTAWIEEGGFLEGPIILTNTHSVGVARDAVIAWRNEHALRHLGLVDVTAFVLAEALARWRNPGKVPPPALLSYRSDVVQLRRARPAG